MKNAEITAGMTVEEVIKILMEIDKDLRFKHHLFKVRGTIDLVFNDDEG